MLNKYMFKILLSFEMQQHVVHLNNLNKRMKGKDIKSILNLTHPPFLPNFEQHRSKFCVHPKLKFFGRMSFVFFFSLKRFLPPIVRCSLQLNFSRVMFVRFLSKKVVLASVQIWHTFSWSSLEYFTYLAGRRTN